MDKGTLSNLVSAAVTGAGLLCPQGTARDVLLSVGLFALSGGVTNALAVKMLFDRIPGLLGSGVVPARFQEIREKIRTVILEHFFDEAYLNRFVEKHGSEIDWKRYVKHAGGGGGRGPLAGLIEKHWDALAAPERLQPFVDAEIEKLLDSNIGGLLIMVGVDSVKPAVRQFVSSLAAGMKQQVIDLASRADLPAAEIEVDEARIIHDVRAQVEVLLAEKLEELDAPTVKRLVEDVIRRHLGWLVVWGNVLGGVLGLAACIFGLSSSWSS
jgi:uncharacterized membrane protein YheB (UPF0754 family)